MADQHQHSWGEFVASLEADDECCDTAMHYGDLERGGPPVRALEFPTPSLAPCVVTSVRAKDHRKGNSRIVENVIVKKPASVNARPETAYLLRKRVAKTTYGYIRMAVVLKRNPVSYDEESMPWVSTEEIVAVKISCWSKIRQLRGQEEELKDPVREAAALQLLGNYHPNVLGCYDVLQDDRNLYLVMPYYSHGCTLHSRLFSEGTHSNGNRKSPTEDEARLMFRQLLKGLFHLQCKGIFHRDLSLDNLLILKDDQLKIVDFGMSLRVPYADPCNDGFITDVSEGSIRRLMKKQKKGGRPMYLAPEVLAEREAFDGFAADLWAAGIILFVLCVGLAPFKVADTSEKRYAKISSGGLKKLMKHLKISISPEACDLLQNMLRADPRDRLSLAEVMNHPWVMGETFVTGSQSVASAVSSEESVGSLSTTEPTQEMKQQEDPSRLKATNSSPKPEAETINLETRESASENREETNSDVVAEIQESQGGIPFLKLQQIAPKLKTNAQQLGPNLKKAIATVNSYQAQRAARATNITAIDTSRKEDDPITPRNSSGSRSPMRRSPRQIISRLKTVIPYNKAAP